MNKNTSKKTGKIPIISMVAAIGKNTRALGRDNELLWRIPDDLKRFRRLTKGHPVIVGRKTYESIGRPLPDRPNIILARETDFEVPGCTVVNSFEDAIDEAKKLDQDEIFIIGGGQIYKQGMQFANRLYLTLVESDDEGDVFFPEYENKFKNVISSEDHVYEGLKFSYVILEK